MLFVKFNFTAILNGSNLAVFDKAELPINKVPVTDEDLKDLEEELRKYIYKEHKTTAFKNLKIESIKWELM